jgi:hypothetical protein
VCVLACSEMTKGEGVHAGMCKGRVPLIYYDSISTVIDNSNLRRPNTTAKFRLS